MEYVLYVLRVWQGYNKRVCDIIRNMVSKLNFDYWTKIRSIDKVWKQLSGVRQLIKVFLDTAGLYVWIFRKTHDIWIVNFTNEGKVFSIITNVLADLVSLNK